MTLHPNGPAARTPSGGARRLAAAAATALAAVLALSAAHPPLAPPAAARVDPPLRVAAAISVRDALTDIARDFERSTGSGVTLSFGSTGQLLAQIREGAPLDLFISAAHEQVDALEREGLVAPDTRRVVARNQLVLITPRDRDDRRDPAREQHELDAGAAFPSDAASPSDAHPGRPAHVRGFAELARPIVQRVAIGDPRTVPAGAYAQQVFECLHLKQPLVRRVVYGANVRQVLDYVARGEVSAGVVYATDARAALGRVRVVAIADDAWHAPIEYPAVTLAASRRKEIAARFTAFLTGPRGAAGFMRHGFATPGASTTQPGELRSAAPRGSNDHRTASPHEPRP
ncbi:MAG: molybdate ABC transporter substrate-binding protein [Phycisphaerae bacterium]